MASAEDSWPAAKSWGGCGGQRWSQAGQAELKGCGTRDSWWRRRAPGQQRSRGERRGGRWRSHAGQLQRGGCGVEC
ncbi:hypothetical protein GUJ93_ZPchr0003g18282 [Zizania palustris]|uniref:Uncharacterized protein n=1 Tax=Zizania palustris TaxID=103762 RepID=A0A8J5STK1_ZIZPA|nr:hypothetical protein GUJ93_ZPchr0003g18282 [Zizania palustris]